mgnify:CR=1 FL=1
MPQSQQSLGLLKGTLGVLILKSLSWQPLHGFEITLWLEEQSGRTLEIDDSAVYQAVHRLEERGLVKGEWGLSEKNRRARYYRLTAAGRAELRAQSAQLLAYARAMTSILTSATPA